MTSVAARPAGEQGANEFAFYDWDGHGLPAEVEADPASNLATEPARRVHHESAPDGGTGTGTGTVGDGTAVRVRIAVVSE